MILTSFGPQEMKPRTWEAIWHEWVIENGARTELEVVVADGPWTTTQRIKVRNGLAVDYRPLHLEAWSGSSPQWERNHNEIRMQPITHSLLKTVLRPDRQMVAFDKHHHRIPLLSRSYFGDRPNEIEVNDPKEVAEIDIQSRPYWIIKFKNICAQPKDPALKRQVQASRLES